MWCGCPGLVEKCPVSDQICLEKALHRPESQDRLSGIPFIIMICPESGEKCPVTDQMCREKALHRPESRVDCLEFRS